MLYSPKDYTLAGWAAIKQVRRRRKEEKKNGVGFDIDSY